MFSIIFWGSVVIFGSITLGVMQGNTEKTYIDKKKVSNEEETFKYFGNLPLEYQEKYFNDNLDLKSYKNDSSVGFTDNKYLNAIISLSEYGKEYILSKFKIADKEKVKVLT